MGCVRRCLKCTFSTIQSLSNIYTPIFVRCIPSQNFMVLCLDVYNQCCAEIKSFQSFDNQSLVLFLSRIFAVKLEKAIELIFQRHP
jgi:hypothetical protein